LVRYAPSDAAVSKEISLRTVLTLFLLILLSMPAVAAETPAPPPDPEPVSLEFSGYKFGRSPSANMVCSHGYCKSQAPGGDGRITLPYSTYETPDAVSTLAGLTVVRPRYTYWDDRLYRVFFQVDCSPLEIDECLDDIVTTLDREYGCLPLSSTETRQFVTDRHVVVKEFLTESGAFIKVRAVTLEGEAQMPMIDIVDKGIANLVGTSLSPTFRPKKVIAPQDLQKP
jgi:hypothetical protein